MPLTHKQLEALISGIQTNSVRRKVVKLANQNLSAADQRQLAHALKSNTHVTQITLSGNNLKTDAYPALFAVMAQHPALVCVELKAIGLDDAMCQSPSFQSLIQSVEICNISFNKLSHDSILRLSEIISKSGLKRLYCDNNPIGMEGAIILMAHLPQTLETLSLVGTNIDTITLEMLQNHLTQDLQIKELNLRSNKLSDSGAAIAYLIKKCPKLQSLDLSYSTISDADLKNQLLSSGINAPNLMTVNLDKSKITTSSHAHILQSLPKAVRPIQFNVDLKGMSAKTSEGFGKENKALFQFRLAYICLQQVLRSISIQSDPNQSIYSLRMRFAVFLARALGLDEHACQNAINAVEEKANFKSSN